MNLAKALLPWVPLDPIASRRRLGIAAVVLMLSAILAGCTRSATWREPVTLNTGETIWAERQLNYTLSTNPENPFELIYRGDPRNSIKFEYRGKRYFYESDGYLQVLAISPQGVPNLVISAADSRWQWKHGYGCVRPSYAQLRPEVNGTSWTWPHRIEPWLYGLPTNLLLGDPPRGVLTSTVTPAERVKRNAYVFIAGKHFQRIDPTYQNPNCVGTS